MTCQRVIMPDRTTGLLCSELETRPNPDCPNAAQHEPWPTGYVAASDHADKMLQTHDQTRCPQCGLWAIWTAKTATEEDR